MKNKKLSQRLVTFILTYTDEDLAGLDQSKMAGIFGVRPSALFREFKDHLPVDLNDFILREKIFRAARAIEKNREITGPELSKKLGFSKFGNFVRHFKAFFLIHPDRYIDLVERKRKGSDWGESEARQKEQISTALFMSLQLSMLSKGLSFPRDRLK